MPKHFVDRSDMPYEDWPGQVQLAFQMYRTLPNPTITALSLVPGFGKSRRTYQQWSDSYDWKGELNRLTRAEAEVTRRAEDDRRRGVLENTRNGMANGLAVIGMALSGICPMCRGTTEVQPRRKDAVKTSCPKCKGSGLFDPTEAPTKSMAILYDRLLKDWGYTEAEDDSAQNSGISPAEQKRLAQEMFQKAGITTALPDEA